MKQNYLQIVFHRVGTLLGIGISFLTILVLNAVQQITHAPQNSSVITFFGMHLARLTKLQHGDTVSVAIHLRPSIFLFLVFWASLGFLWSLVLYAIHKHLRSKIV